MTRALVIGGAGFLGAALVERLLAEEYTVDVVDDLSGGSLSRLAGARAAGQRRFTFHQLDAGRPALDDLVIRRRPDVVYHLASPRSGSRADPAATVSTAWRVLSACLAGEVGKLVVGLSTALYGAFGAVDLPLKEAALGRPDEPVGVAETAVVGFLRVARDRDALEFTALVLPEVYGPGAERGTVAVMAGPLVAGTTALVDGTDGDTRDYVFVDDVVDALARAAGRGGGLVVNVGWGQETSGRRLQALVAEAARSLEPVAWRPPAFPGPPRLTLDGGRAGIHLGWSPWTTLEDGVEATVAWWRSRRTETPGT